MDRADFRQWLALRTACQPALGWFDTQPGTVEDIYNACNRRSWLKWLCDEVGMLGDYDEKPEWQEIKDALFVQVDADTLRHKAEKQRDFIARVCAAGLQPGTLRDLEWWKVPLSPRYMCLSTNIDSQEG